VNVLGCLVTVLANGGRTNVGGGLWMCLCVEIGVCVWAHVNTARARIRHGPTRGENRRTCCVRVKYHHGIFETG
jgi:hypothetical protein